MASKLVPRLLSIRYKFLSWSEWNIFTANIVPFTPTKVMR